MAKAILVVDMLNDFVREQHQTGGEMLKGKLVVKGAEAVVQNIGRIKGKAGEYGVLVMYANDAHTPDDPEFLGYGGNWPEHAVKGTPGAEVIPELAPGKGNVVIEKQDLSVFTNPETQALLKREGIDEIYVMGVATEYCVRGAALDAIAAGYKVNVVVDGIEGVDEILLPDGNAVPETKGAVARALLEMGNAGAKPVYTNRVLEEIVR